MITCASITKALVVRLLLILHVFLCTWRVSINLNNPMYWLLLCLVIPLVIECFYTMIRRKGNDFSRFTLCFFFYLGAVLPGIWLLELDRSDLYIKGVGVQNARTEDPTAVGLGQSIWLIVVEEVMPYMIFICRWIIPRGSVTKEELSDLLFAYIEIGADIMEFFSLLDEDVIRANKALGYTVLTIWTVSILQFTMTITIIYKPKKKKNAQAEEVDEKEEEWKKTKHDIFVIFMVLLMQDLPFLIVRMYIIINFNRITYSLIFFISKNLLIFVLLLHRVAILCQKRHCPDLDEANDKSEAIHGTAETNNVERGRVRRRDSLAGSLAPYNLGTSSGYSNSGFNNLSLDADSNLKKRGAKVEQSANNGTRHQRSNGDIRTSSERPQLPQRSAEGNHHSNSIPKTSSSFVKVDRHSTSPSAVSRNDRLRKHDSGFDDYMEPVVAHQTNSRPDNFTHDRMQTRLPEYEYRKSTIETPLQLRNLERDNTISMPTVNNWSVYKQPNTENLQHSNQNQNPKLDMSNKTTQTIQESYTQTDSPEPQRKYVPERSFSGRDKDDSPRMHSSISTQVIHSEDARSEVKDDPGPHVTRIIL